MELRYEIRETTPSNFILPHPTLTALPQPHPVSSTHGCRTCSRAGTLRDISLVTVGFRALASLLCADRPPLCLPALRQVDVGTLEIARVPPSDAATLASRFRAAQPQVGGASQEHACSARRLLLCLGSAQFTPQL